MQDTNETICCLCLKPAAMMASVGACYHLYCQHCGEYLIAISVLECFDINPEYKKKKSLLSGMTFEANCKGEVLQITPDMLEKARDITLHEKLFKLATFFYNRAKEENSCLRQNPACCYESNNKKYRDLMKTLQKYAIVDFTFEEDDSEDYVSSFVGVEMPISAMLEFKGITTLNDFEEAFMNKGKNKSGINIDNVNQVNFAMDYGTINATQNNNPTLQEFQSLCDNLIKQIPLDASSEEKAQVNEGLELLKTELQKPRPRKNAMSVVMSGIKGLFNTTAFAASALSIIEFISKSIH